MQHPNTQGSSEHSFQTIKPHKNLPELPTTSLSTPSFWSTLTPTIQTIPPAKESNTFMIPDVFLTSPPPLPLPTQHKYTCCHMEPSEGVLVKVCVVESVGTGHGKYALVASSGRKNGDVARRRNTIGWGETTEALGGAWFLSTSC